jgi:hypothetical protein
MDSLQTEIDSLGWASEVHFLGVNAIGQQGGNNLIPLIAHLPWLQDDGTQHVWESWNANWRDIIVLDQNNTPVARFNVTDYSLVNPANFNDLKSLLEIYANASP